jgi:hypothetical protein
MADNVKVNWYPGKKKEVLDASDKIMYSIARQTLDKSLVHIPFKSGKMRQTSMSAGVRGSNKNYYIGSYTNYAKYVWFMPSTTNWSEPGTFGKWYQKIYTRQKKNIVGIAIKENELK